MSACTITVIAVLALVAWAFAIGGWTAERYTVRHLRREIAHMQAQLDLARARKRWTPQPEGEQ